MARAAPVSLAQLCTQAHARGELRLFRSTTDLWRAAGDEALSEFARRCAREQAERVEADRVEAERAEAECIAEDSASECVPLAHLPEVPSTAPPLPEGRARPS